MSDLMFYSVLGVFFTGVVAWLLAALYLVVGVVRGLVWCLRRATGRHRRTAATEKPGIPHQSGGAR